MMPLLLVVSLIAAAGMLGVWYGRLQERAAWTRRIMRRGGGNVRTTSGDTLVVDTLGAGDEEQRDAMREAVEEIAREVERLAEGQRFLTDMLSERKSIGDSHLPPSDPS